MLEVNETTVSSQKKSIEVVEAGVENPTHRYTLENLDADIEILSNDKERTTEKISSLKKKREEVNQIIDQYLKEKK